MIYSDSKITDLVKVVGEDTPENFSPTLRAKLVSINEYDGTCTMEVVKSIYPAHSFSAQHNHRAGERYQRPLECVWNAFFF